MPANEANVSPPSILLTEAGRQDQFLRQFTRFASLSIGALTLTSCGVFSFLHSANVIRKTAASPYHAKVPVIRWHRASLGSQALLKEGTAISSVLPGPSGRIYYGTGNSFGTSNVIGWYNPDTGHSAWYRIPKVPPFPRQSGFQTSHLTLSESTYWGAVDLIVSGNYTIWYHHWGYVGGLTTRGRFVPGDYAIVGPTAHRKVSTASIQTAFGGNPTLRVMNTENKQMLSYPMPTSLSSPVGIAFGQKTNHIWLLDPNTLWRLNTASRQWTPVTTSAMGDFFVGMGEWHWGLWVVDANGNIDTIGNKGHLIAISHVPIHPIAAKGAGQYGIWLVSKHHLILWEPHQPIKTWSWPHLSYPVPASSTQQGLLADWPPLPHIQKGPHDVLDIGYGPFIGQAYFKAKIISPASH